MKSEGTLLGRVLRGLNVRFEIDSLSYARVLKLGDILYRPDGVIDVVYDGDIFHVSASSVSRILYYAPGSIIEYYRGGRLYALMKEVLNGKDDVFIDVGANLGMYGYLAKKRGATSILFEPEPRLYEFLKANASIVGTPHPLALSDSAGEQAFHIGSEHAAGAHSLVGHEASDSPYVDTVSVQTDTFDEWIGAEGMEDTKIALVKIDVEGNEDRTVRGMEKTLERGTVDNVWCEVRGPQSGRNPNSYVAVSKLFRKYGYMPYRYTNGRRTPFEIPDDRVPQVFDILYTRT